MRRLQKIKALCALALCLLLAACGGGGPKQEAADSAEEATVHFLTNLQKGEFEQARTYLEEENPLLTVFPAAEGEDAPELDAVYRHLREKRRCWRPWRPSAGRAGAPSRTTPDG